MGGIDIEGFIDMNFQIYKVQSICLKFKLSCTLFLKTMLSILLPLS